MKVLYMEDTVANLKDTDISPGKFMILFHQNTFSYTRNDGIFPLQLRPAHFVNVLVVICDVFHSHKEHARFHRRHAKCWSKMSAH